MKKVCYAAAAALPVLGGVALPAAQAAAAVPQHRLPAVRGKTVSARPLGVTPASASGCNGDICIGVQGTKLWVSDVKESIYLKGRHCGKWYLTYAGVRYGSTYMCVQGHASTSWLVESSFYNGTKICVSAAGIPGKPCETVHS